MNIGEEQPPIELPLPSTPETVPEQEDQPGRPDESEPERSVPDGQPDPHKVPA